MIAFLVGGIVGVCAGLIWTSVFQTSSFEGYSGMLVFYSFMPIGIILGGLIGAGGLAFAASRDRAAVPKDVD